MKIQMLLLLGILFGCLSITTMEANEKPNMSCVDFELLFDTPKNTFRSYLFSILCDDFDRAKKCWVISDDNKSEALDVISGLWVTYHRFNRVITDKYEKKVEELINEDCTDSAIRLTLSRIEESKVEVKESGKSILKIKWKKGDGYPNPAFFYQESLAFKKTKNGWKIDADDMTGETPEEFLAAGGWGRAMAFEIKAINAVVDEIEHGTYRNYSEFIAALQGKRNDAQRQWMKEHESKK